MPYFAFVTAILAGAIATPLSNWQYRYPDKKAVLEACSGTSAVGIVQNLTTGAESIVQAETPVGIGFAAGALPARLNSEIIMDPVEAGQEIVWTFRNTTVGTLTVNGWVTLTWGKVG